MRRISNTKNHLSKHTSRTGLYRLVFMVLFFIIFDGIVMYLAPIVMQNAGVSLGSIGLILGLSSVAGMVFDILLLRLLGRSSYRSIFLYMFLSALVVPFFLFGGTTITFYLLAMAFWGLYYNLYYIGTLDFVSRTVATSQHTSSFGILKVFEGLGYMIAPFLGSIILLDISAMHPIPIWLFVILLTAFILYLFVLGIKVPMSAAASAVASTSDTPKRSKKKTVINLFGEVRIWEKVGGVIFPLLLLTLVINLVDAAVWTIGPIFSESLAIDGGASGGALMLAYTIPPLFVGFFVGRLADRFGKRLVALGSLFLGSALLLVVGLASAKLVVIGAIFLVSFFFALVWPTINGSFEDIMSETTGYHEEIETIDDWFTNVGDTLGPIMGGYAAQFLGIRTSFIVMGVFGAIVALVLFRFTPRNLAKNIAGAK